MVTPTTTGRIDDAETLLKSKGGAFNPSTASLASTSSAIQYFTDAAKQIDYHSSTGLALYKSAMDTAKSEIVSNYQNAIAALKPQEQASRAALDEMMRFTGVDPVQATAGMTDSLKGLQGLEGSQLNNLIRQAEQERDPTKRAALRDQIAAEFDASQQSATTAREQLIAQQQGSLPKPIKMETPAKPEWTKQGQYGSPYGLALSSGERAAQEAYQAELKDWNTKVATSNSLYDTQLASYNRNLQDIANSAVDNTGQLAELKSQFLSSYKPEYDAAYTGDQVINKLEATPGYQFQMDAGTKAIERQGASKGMLGSGNTLLSLQKYGQDLAQGFYQQHLSNLQNIAQQGSGAATGIANLFSQKGTLLSSLSEKLGTQSANTYDLIGQGYAAAFNKAGEVEFQSNQQLAANRFAAQESAKSRAVDIAGKIISSEPANRQLDQAAGAAQGMAAAAADKKDSSDGSKFYRDAEGRLQSPLSAGVGGIGYLNTPSAIPGAKPVPGTTSASGNNNGGAGGSVSV